MMTSLYFDWVKDGLPNIEKKVDSNLQKQLFADVPQKRWS